MNYTNEPRFANEPYNAPYNATNTTHVIQPAEQVHLVDDHPMYNRTDCQRGDCHMDSCHNCHEKKDIGTAAKEKLNDAGRAIKNTAEKIGDKAVELKDKAKDAITGH
ncbi:hypothetical protein GCK32_001415 [Trichostrongylus colubriformis]|uniref:Uncharacterized protein n=1 Tax=Trichostrongylus colubriformis TaxID=6319 RepID=A0AAN8EYC8_TRICO